MGMEKHVFQKKFLACWLRIVCGAILGIQLGAFQYHVQWVILYLYATLQKKTKKSDTSRQYCLSV